MCFSCAIKMLVCIPIENRLLNAQEIKYFRPYSMFTPVPGP